jgi:hypothetical protein
MMPRRVSIPYFTLCTSSNVVLRVNSHAPVSSEFATMLTFLFGQTIRKLAMYFGRLECFDPCDVSDKVDGM